MYRILIVDDHPLLAGGLKTLLTDYKICSEVDVAASGRECIRKLKSAPYDLVLLDINLPDVNGIDLCETLHKEFRELKILALTGFSEFSCVDKMLKNGASGYILKNAMPEEIIKGVETVMAGELYLCNEVDLLMKKEKDTHVFLTRRETDLLRLITQGYSNEEMAEKLFLAIETIKSYRKNLLFKLNAKNTAALVKMALEEKLI